MGLTRGSNRAHIARAALEGIAYSVADLLRVMRADAGCEFQELRVDGGASANNLLLQFQSDILGVDVVRPKVLETTAMGAAYLAGLAVGVWSNAEEVAENWHLDRTFEPELSREQAQQLCDVWERAVERSKSWIEA